MSLILETWARLHKDIQTRTSPETAQNLLDTGRALKAEGHTQQAVQAFSAAIQLYPEKPEAFFEVSQILKAAGDKQRADEFRCVGLNLSRGIQPSRVALNNELSPSHSVWFITGGKPNHKKECGGFLEAGSIVHDACGNWIIAQLKSPHFCAEESNKALDRCLSTGAEWAVFAKSDLTLGTTGVWDLLRQSRAAYGAEIVGVAGGSGVDIKIPAVWTAICDCLLGRLPYRSASGEIIPNVFGPLSGAADILDEVFFGVHVPSAVAAGWRFNEAFAGTHCVTASFLDARLSGLKLAVAPFELLQEAEPSFGVAGEHWKESQDRFLNTFGKHTANA